MATFISRSGFIPSTSHLISYYASFSTALMLLRNVYRELVPQKLEEYVLDKLRFLFFSKVSPSCCSFIIDDSWEFFDHNELIEAAARYLSNKIGIQNKKVRVGKFRKEQGLTTGLVPGEEIVDEFKGIKVTWLLVREKGDGADDDRKRNAEGNDNYFMLTFEEEHRDVILKDYFNHILDTHENMKKEKKVLKLFTRGGRGSVSKINFNHPATFETIAMDNDLKKSIIADLDKFLSRKDFYRRVGKTWKRGYLLYGPPGTGKSSLIAAMANHLKYNIYNLELGTVKSDIELRDMLLDTADKSIIVVEDIDCNQEVWNRDAQSSNFSRDYNIPKVSDCFLKTEAQTGDVKSSNFSDYKIPKFTLSTLLNCIDGLWSVCGEERIFVFTTNHKEILDPALLRPGRMDMHIHMSYCTTQGFRILASNYLEIKEHPLFEEIDDLIKCVDVTPAALAEELMRSDLPDDALRGVVDLLKQKRIERDTKEVERAKKMEK
ncbi:hypothetical protein K2173_006103 [Erythroxylum novogranatense]|uniref:AAA+ ATPase domain-containing protein n=1 Tax=Erythroxylum novogranatense TaxID=1862640 RepID=A0AAV8TDQ8_9ROSI|nr:hypothetical protein K2173_006103 [Erythroxylum novogranatense]